ncbi:hypothetical protein ACTXIV_13835 [Psychrobacter celer]|uniref:hypothetical protein n=1 Tax=Psychrobacter celer TaxID=306572 RepID=UPI003FD3F7E0
MSESAIKIILGIQKVPVITIKSLPDHELIKEFGFNFFDAQHLFFFFKISLISTVIFLSATTVVVLAQGSAYATYFKFLLVFLILSLFLAVLTCQLFRYHRKKASTIQRILRSRGL